MNVFVTGGTGLTGSSIIEKLAANGFHISALYRNRKNPTSGVNWVFGDLTAVNSDISSMLAGAEIVIHNAACLKPGNTPSERTEIDAVNINFTKNLLNAVLNSGVKKIIFTSSLSFIRKPLPQPVTEESETNPNTPYAESKLTGEKMIERFSAEHGIEYNILRLSSPVGSNLGLMHRNVLKTWIEKSINKETIQVFGDGERTQDFVSTEDISRAFLLCIMNKEVTGTFNIASGSSLSMKSLAKIITNKFGNKFELKGDDVNNNDRWNISIDKAKKLLGYQPELNSEQAIVNLLNSIES